MHTLGRTPTEVGPDTAVSWQRTSTAVCCGSDAANADKADKAGTYLNAHSAGTGPYMLNAFSPGTSITFTANPSYWGTAPKLKKVAVLNQQAPTEKLTLEKGDTDIGLNLSPSQLRGLKGDATLAVSGALSPNIFFLLLNLDPSVGGPMANSNVRQAVRYALDYQGIALLAGQGSIQAAGIVPVQYLGALPASAAPKQDVAKAKSLLKAAGFAGGVSVSMEYPSDITINGEDFGLFAQKVQSDLAAVGINAKLTPKRVAVALPNYRGGKEQVGFWEWGPDYPDPSDYLNFLPGQLAGLRANWKAGADASLGSLMKQAVASTDNAKRAAIYRQIQMRLNLIGPFVPLFQPVQVVAAQVAVNLGQYAMSDPKIVTAYRHQWGLDQPAPVQFVVYLGNMLHGDLGISQQTHRPVATDLRQYLPATAELAVTAILIAVLVGIPLGIVSAVYHRRLPDHLARLFALMGASVPVFWLGLIGLDVLYVHFSLLPAPGRLDEALTPPHTRTGLFTVDSLLTGNWADLHSSIGHLILPALVLSCFSIGLFTRITRAAMLETLGKHYIRTARSKGLPRWRVIMRHALPNTLIPTLTSVGLAFANLLTGAVLAETVFAWPGIGRYAFQAASNLDFPAIVGVTNLVALVYILVNLAVDLLYGVVDPRIRAR